MHYTYSAEQLEIKAEKILNNYKNGFFLEKPSPIDVDDFAEFYVKAIIDYANLSDDKKTLGLTCFYEGIIEVWDEKREKIIKIHSYDNTIFLDTDTDLISSNERTRFTIMHECCHIILHKRLYYVGPNQMGKKIPYTPFVNKGYKEKFNMTESEICEWQANKLAAALLVPRKTLYRLLQNKLNRNTVNDLNLSDDFIGSISKYYEVSFEMMRVRLRDLKILKN